MKRDTEKLAEALEDISNIYKNSENQILQIDSEWGNWWSDDWGQIWEEISRKGTIDHTSSTVEEWSKKILSENPVCSLLSPGIACLTGLGATFENDSWSDKLKDYYANISGMTLKDVGDGESDIYKWGTKNKKRDDKDSFGYNKESSYTYDKKTGKFVRKEEEKDNKKGKKKLDKNELAENITIYESTYSFLDDDKKGTIIGTTDNGSTITLGKKDLYIKHKLTAGNFETSIGGAYSVLSIDVPEQSIGISGMDIHYSGNVDFLSASANAKFGVGWLNENGEIDPHLEANFSAEATAVKFGGTVGVDILGTDVDVTGSVGVGLGGHFNAGYNDGVFTLDMGMYMGIGGDVKLDINVGEMLDNAVDFAEDAYCAVGEGLQELGEGLQEMGEGIQEGLQELGDWLTFWD